MKKIISNVLKVSSLRFNPILYSNITIKPPLNLLHQPIKFKIATNTHYKNQSHSKFQGPGFYMQQMLAGCLSIFSYYLQSGNQCFIIDPQIDITKYVQIIEKRGKILKGVFLSHYHADYIAGHHQLKKKYGCNIYMGPKSIQQDKLISMNDGQQIILGQTTLKLIHTPGHTNQSSCLLLIDKNGKQSIIFTGDTVFINEVGRPDLATTQKVTAKDLAQQLYDSIQKIKKISDEVRIYPGHCAGSSCGKAIGAGEYCTIGNQKKSNYAFKSTDRVNFADLILKQMPKPPQYFGYDAKINKFTPFSYQQSFKKANVQLGVNELQQLLEKQKPIVIDVRDNLELLKKGIIKNSICIGFEGSFASWVGTLLNPLHKYVIYGNKSQIQDTIKRLFRIGYINILGYAKFDIQQWINKKLPFYTADILPSNVIQKGRYILDVRKPAQWGKGVLNVQDLVKFQLSDLYNNINKLDKNKKYSIHCARGYRAKIAYSILKNNGFDAKYYPQSFQNIVTASKVGTKI